MYDIILLYIVFIKGYDRKQVGIFPLSESCRLLRGNSR